MAVFLLKFSGTLASGLETFQYSIVVDDALLAGDEELWSQYAADGLQAAFDAVPNANPFPINTIHTGVSAARVLNLSTGELSAAHNRAVNFGGSNQPTLPPQCSVAVSLTGGNRPNGTPIKGRFYLPGPREDYVDSAGRLSTGGQNVYWLFANALVQHFNMETEEAAPQVWSRTLGNTTTVTQLRIGRAIDTIRSRRSSLPEDYLDEGTPL